MGSGFRPPHFTLSLLFFYLAEGTVSFWNWWWFIATESNLFGSTLVQAHIGFNILGALVFLIFSSPFLFWPYRYSSQMPARTRRNAVAICLYTVFFLHDFPLWMMEFWVCWKYGWIHVLQGISLILLTFAAAYGTFSVWLTYAWKMAKFLQRYYGSATFNTVAASEGALRSTRLDAVQRV
eukprot:PhF_6_TR18727/c0_g1_i1/m.27358